MRDTGKHIHTLAITGLVFVVLIVTVCSLIGNISRTTSQAETEQVRASVRSAALTCYAVEGAYPSSLDYLREHYGLYYDESVYIVSYSTFASNIFPDIVVMEGGDGLQ